MQKVTLFTLFLVLCFTFLEYSVNAMSCDSCGSECARACGTRHFRSCCFNYVRKRSSSPLPNHISFETLGKPSIESFKKNSKELQFHRSFKPSDFESYNFDIIRQIKEQQEIPLNEVYDEN